MISLAPPRAVAGKIASAHNSGECKHCHRAFPEGGVLAFGLSGSDARWYPDEESARRQTTGVRYMFPVGSEPVAPGEVVDWLERQRDDIEQLVEQIEQQRDERRMRRLIEEDQSGFRTDPYPCADCGYPKHRPADRCDRCGDEPCSLAIDPHDYNRGYGYRD